MTESTEAAVLRAAQGDLAAFTELVRRHQRAAFAYALTLLGDHHLAEDAVQEAFVEAHRSLARLESPEAFAGWLRGIVRHRCLRRLRRRDVGLTVLEEDGAASEETPPEALVHRERRALALATVRSLPRPLSEAVTLFYVCDCTQREAAAFLGVSVATLNNRLHQARGLMKRRIIDMVTETLRETALPDDYAARIGRILSVDGVVVEAHFDAAAGPEVFDSLRLSDGAAEMRVTQVLDEGIVRCIVTAGGATLAPGQPVANVTTESGVSVAPAADEAAVARAVASLGLRRPEAPVPIETGIKSLDLLCPLPARGNVALLGTAGTGKMVLTHELARRLDDRDEAPRVAYFGAAIEPALVRDLRAQEEAWPRDAAGRIWILTDLATDPTYAARNDVFDATVYCSLLVGAQGLWPAIDPFHSASRVALAPRHAAVAGRAREALLEAKRLTSDAVFLEYLACRAFAAARQRLREFVPRRLAELSPEQRTRVGRARRVERFLTTPFFVAEEANRRPGLSVAREDTLDGVESILAGEFDDVPEERFVFIGRVAEARASG